MGLLLAFFFLDLSWNAFGICLKLLWQSRFGLAWTAFKLSADYFRCSLREFRYFLLVELIQLVPVVAAALLEILGVLWAEVGAEVLEFCIDKVVHESLLFSL